MGVLSNICQTLRYPRTMRSQVVNSENYQFSCIFNDEYPANQVAIWEHWHKLSKNVTYHPMLFTAALIPQIFDLPL